MSESAQSSEDRLVLGRASVPVKFGEQVIVSILYNHDANPVHHRPDHAIQWMLGLVAMQGVGADDPALQHAGPEERTYAMGTRLLAQQDVVVMPGIVLAAICYERFIAPSEVTVSVTTSFTHPLLVPTKGGVEVSIAAYELPASPTDLAGCRKILIEAFGPGLSGAPARLLKLEAEIYRAGTDREMLFEKVVRPKFDEFSKQAAKSTEYSGLSHPSSISQEDRRRYSRIVEPETRERKARPITESAWQCKIPRVLTEVIDHLRLNEKYQTEVNAYYSGRPDEAERRAALRRYVEKECKYHTLKDAMKEARVEELAQRQQHLYAKQHTVFDPRKFGEKGAATATGAQMLLDLQLSEMRLRRAIHRFYTAGRLQSDHVFMGEATVMAQPLVTRELSNFLCEINYSFDTLRLLEYRHS